MLILLNGFFAAAEIAVVSSRRSRIQQLAKEGKRGAQIVAAWLKEPEVFLATVQIAITLIGALASAIGGVIAVEYLKPKIHSHAMLAPFAEFIALVLVVLPITYLTLILGELAPKSLAFSYRERMATTIALPVHFLSRAVRTLVSFLTWSARAVLFLFGKKNAAREEFFVSEEEIRHLIKEGASQGIFDQAEQQMIPKVFDFSQMRIKDMMIRREHITALDAATPRERLVQIVSEEGYTRLPVFQGSLDKISGILHMKDLIHIINLGKIIVLQDLVRPAVFVRESTLAQDLLKLFQKQRLHMAIVQDEKGITVGLITLEDLLERIVGDIRDEHDVG